MIEKENKIVNLLFGLPSNAAEDEKLLSDFFRAKGLHIVCGGTTAIRTAAYLGKPLAVELPADEIVAPIGHIEGVTLVTEGILTMRQVLFLISEAKSGDILWRGKTDGASQIAKYLTEASNIFFHVGLAENKEKAALGLSVKEKSELIFAISELLISMGKTVKTVIYN